MIKNLPTEREDMGAQLVDGKLETMMNYVKVGKGKLPKP